MKKLILSALVALPAFAGTFQLSCDEVRTAACPMHIDRVVSCTASYGFTSLTARARNDNTCSLMNTLEEQICDMGLDPAKFTVDCQYR